ncbi:MAG: S-layer homology domain-containing protein [Alicyclobacillaceae bacterium]|nr:S-layer homology domain-containing protein [Alicyclobacillaceae bacterium]
MKIWKRGALGVLTALLTASIAGVPAAAGDTTGRHPVMKSGSWTAPVPQGYLTNAEMAVMFKSMFGFHAYFVVPPKVEDYFERVQDGVWYTQAFLDCKLSGVDLPKDIDPHASVTREQFAHYLRTALAAKGVDPVVPLVYRVFQDEDQIDPTYRSDIQFMTYFGVMPVEGDAVRPKDPVTRGSAAAMLSRAVLLWMDPDGTWKSGFPAKRPEGKADEVAFEVKRLNDKVNEVTLTWGEKPNGCYALEITGIRFSGDEAVVLYRTRAPGKGDICPQVVVRPAATTYVDAKYKIRIAEDDAGPDSNGGRVSPDRAGAERP